jgi:uncharacterized repeat protein (TIGR03803 family)
VPVVTPRSFGLLLVLGLLLALHVKSAGAAEYKILHQFCADQKTCRDGFDLSAPLVRDPQGNLYGTANGGGAFGFGTVFRLSPTRNGKWKFDVLHDFCSKPACMDGFAPQAPVIVDRQGNLYGVAAANSGSEEGDGVVYRLRPNGKHWDFEVLYEFCPGDVCDGAFPQAGLAYVGQSTGASYDGVSPLFGVAGAGGANGDGVAFMLVPKNGKWKHTDIYSFCAEANCADGGGPDQPLVVQDALHLVGVAGVGGTGGSGVVFRLTSDDGTTWSESVVHAFCSLEHCADGAGFPSSLATDAAGNLYGTTPTGGKCDRFFACGTIYRIAPDGTETVLFDFCKRVGGCKVGSDPGAGVTVGPDGKLYGTTVAGGTRGVGAIFAFDGSKMELLHSFCDMGCEFGGNSRSPMIIDPRGRLYGVTPQGDTSGGGVVYELVP